MSKSFWLTPEEAIRKKKRNKYLLYTSIMIGMILLSTFLTILMNKI